MELCHLELELSGCTDEELTALDSGHYTRTQVGLRVSGSGHSRVVNDTVTS